LQQMKRLKVGVKVRQKQIPMSHAGEVEYCARVAYVLVWK
jgi:hypothetical protein